jgi:hypothetical protein
VSKAEIEGIAAERIRLLRLMCKAEGLDPNAPFLLFDPNTPGYDQYVNVAESHSRMVARYNEDRLSAARREVRRVLQENKNTQRRYTK